MESVVARNAGGQDVEARTLTGQQRPRRDAQLSARLRNSEVDVCHDDVLWSRVDPRLKFKTSSGSQPPTDKTSLK